MLGFLILYFIYFGTLVMFFVLFLTFKMIEGPFIRLPDSPHYGLWVGSAIIGFFSIIVILLGGRMGIPILLLIAISVVLFLLIKRNELKKTYRERLKKIKALKQRLDEAPNDFGTLMALGNLYEQSGENSKALDYYSRAEKVIGFAENSLAGRKVAELKYAIKLEEEKRPVVCPRCGARNLENAVVCRRCYKVLKSPVQVWKEMNKYAKMLIMVLGLQYIVFGFLFSLQANVLLWAITIIDIILFYLTFRED